MQRDADGWKDRCRCSSTLGKLALVLVLFRSCHMLMPPFILCATFSAGASLVVAQEKKEPAKIDRETITAYEKLLAKYGGIEIAHLRWEFKRGKEMAAKHLPAFHFA